MTSSPKKEKWAPAGAICTAPHPQAPHPFLLRRVWTRLPGTAEVSPTPGEASFCWPDLCLPSTRATGCSCHTLLPTGSQTTAERGASLRSPGLGCRNQGSTLIVTHCKCVDTGWLPWWRWPELRKNTVNLNSHSSSAPHRLPDLLRLQN